MFGGRSVVRRELCLMLRTEIANQLLEVALCHVITSTTNIPVGFIDKGKEITGLLSWASDHIVSLPRSQEGS